MGSSPRRDKVYQRVIIYNYYRLILSALYGTRIDNPVDFHYLS